MLKTIKLLLVFLITVLFLIFAVVNRAAVSIDLFPLPYVMEMPKFILALVCIALGIIIGWIVVSVRLSKNYFRLQAEHKRVLALQNELSALHAEKDSHMPALSSDL